MLTSEENESVQAGVAMMSRQVDHLVRLIDDLLDVSRISRGQIELRRESMDLKTLVAQAVVAVRPLYDARRRGLTIALPAAPLPLQGDATRLTQVVTNLLTNGARYTSEGGQVWLSLEETGQEARLVVRDDGIGLAPDQLSRIFEQFVQVDTALNRAEGGLGLGLSLVRNLVELHGGRVEARSKGLNQGSEFVVSLPLSPEPAKAGTTPKEPTSPAEKPRYEVLVVDDNRDAADTLSMLLKRKGYQIHTRYGGREALEAAENRQPDVILLDISMPEMDGYQTCRLLRQQPWGESIVVIALTGYGQQEARQVSAEAGFDGHLVKPVDLKTLTELVDLLYRNKRAS
jgi:two-component system CheB/CheR fusion protein